MADNKNYYYIKLKENYFEQDNIKVLESMKNGHIYSLIIIKMYLKASKSDGQLMMTQRIPYDPSNVDTLAGVLGHDVDHVKESIRLGVQLDLIKIIEGKEIWMTEIQNMIGRSSTEADRIRIYRKKLDEKILPESKSVQMYDKSTPELEIELEKEIKLKREKDSLVEPTSEVTEIFETFHTLCPSLPKPSKLTQSRKKAISARIKEYSKDEILDALKTVEKSDFLTGRKTEWRADIDWIFKAGNFLKIVEGKYKNVDGGKPSQRTLGNSDRWDKYRNQKAEDFVEVKDVNF